MALEGFNYRSPEEIVGKRELQDAGSQESQENREADLKWAMSMIEEAEFRRLAAHIQEAIKDRGSDSAEDYHAIMENPNIGHDYTVGQLAALNAAIENKH